MPQIDTIRVHRFLWVGTNVKDDGSYNCTRLGFTQEQAERRCFAALPE